jgi:hypothetical protein
MAGSRVVRVEGGAQHRPRVHCVHGGVAVVFADAPNHPDSAVDVVGGVEQQRLHGIPLDAGFEPFHLVNAQNVPNIQSVEIFQYNKFSQ